jgi:hypothetical protein
MLLHQFHSTSRSLLLSCFPRKIRPLSQPWLGRDEIKIGLAENGGDPTQDGCFFEVDNAESAFAELKANGLEKESLNLAHKNMARIIGKYFSSWRPMGCATASVKSKRLSERMI